jgi:hypothetical protein
VNWVTCNRLFLKDAPYWLDVAGCLGQSEYCVIFMR